uniref:RNA-binding protein 39-like n=1 Tax=Styela clava TaxID=7725 RepID=UPI0019397B8E|nr:RNA-binding protein 39-like [Styela clava]
MADDIDVEAMLEAPFRKDGENGDAVDRDRKKKESSRKRDRDRKHERSRSHKRSRSRKRSRDRKHRSRSRDRSRERRERRRSRERRSRSQEKRRRSRSRERKRSRSPKREPVLPPSLIETNDTPKERSPSPGDRDARTVFCMQLSQRIRPRDLEEFFSSVGVVRDVKLIADKHSKRSKGIAYVEFKDHESIPLALGLSGQKVLGVPIIVQPSQSEKNKVVQATTQATVQKGNVGPMKLYVGSLHQNITEDMLKGIFSPFGKIDQVQLVKDPDTGISRGYGFITFMEADCAKRALEQLNGFEIAGKPMKVANVTDKADQQAAMALAAGQGGPSFLDNDAIERTGIDLGTTGRLQLMAKLAEGTGLHVPSITQQALSMGQAMGLGLRGSVNVGTDGVDAAPAAPPIATTCFQLSNMFDPKTETDPDWDSEIRSDVIEECGKHGNVLHVYVDKNSDGNVYVKCGTLDSAAKSVAALHGRYFAGKMITAAYVPLVNYHALFPDSATTNTSLVPKT